MSVTTLGIAVLLEMLKASTKTMEVCAPSQDFYRRRDEWTTETISYICPDALSNELQQLLNHEEKCEAKRPWADFSEIENAEADEEEK